MSPDYRTEILEQAAAICAGIVRTAGDSADNLHLRGLLARGDARDDLALPYLTRAAMLAPASPAPWLTLADELHAKGRHVEAAQACRRAAVSTSRQQALSKLGRALLHLGRLDEARTWLEEALALNGEDAATHSRLGDVLLRLDVSDAALVAYRRACALDVSNAETHLHLGRAHLHRREWRAALDVFQRGLSLDPDAIEVHVGMGCAWRGLCRLDEAVQAFRSALAIDPRHIEAGRQLICAVSALGSAEDASAWFSFGAALQAHGRMSEARIAYRQTLARAPRHVRALFALGAAHLQLRAHRQALACFKAVLALQPRHVPARFNDGWTRQILGDFRSGWRAFRWHHAHGHPARRYFEQPSWNGERLDGRTLLLWSDQGLGDAIQYLRYAERAKSRGGRIVVECDPALAPLVRRLRCVDEVVLPRRPGPPIDTHAKLTELPRLFRTRLDTIPKDVPYLTVDSSLVDAWRLRLGRRTEKVIGLVWSGDRARRNAHVRFTSLASFAPLAGMPGVCFVSLQHGPPAVELLAPPPGLTIALFKEASESLLQTAALMMNLDLVITVDTVTAHLAGALGLSVWTLLPYAPDWRWGRSGTACAWYPTMTLFRPDRPGDWPGVLNRVRSCLVAALRTAAPDVKPTDEGRWPVRHTTEARP